MSFFKILKGKSKQETKTNIRLNDIGDRRENGAADGTTGRSEEDGEQRESAKLTYLVSGIPDENLIALLRKLMNQDIQMFVSEDECRQYMVSLNQKIFLVLDSPPSPEFLEAIDQIKDLDTLFIYHPVESCMALVESKQRHYASHWCQDLRALKETVERAREEVHRHATAFTMYNKKEKSTRDLSKERGSFLFFQLFKTVMKAMPRTAQAKKDMVTRCREYYRGSAKDLQDIDEFDKAYVSSKAIWWYTKEGFVYKFINKALRTEDVDVLYRFRFYIVDLSEQLEAECEAMKQTQKEVLKLYRGQKLSKDEVQNMRNSIGNLISTNGYLSTSTSHDVAYEFATKPTKRPDACAVMFEYQVDLSSVKSIVCADIQKHSFFQNEAEVLVDIGASFQIESCTYNEEAKLWKVILQATDQGADIAAEYMEYQKKKMAESDVSLMFGNLLLDMGEYSKAENYFDTILNSAQPNDEEIACIYFNFGRTHRLKGDFNRAIDFYHRAYNLHVNARPKRSASAGKTLNGLGVVYSEQGKYVKAEECFLRAMQFYSKSIPKKHVDVGGTLINLGIIDCHRGEFEQATEKFLKALKIYDRSLPPDHPHGALPRMNLGNIYLTQKDYAEAIKKYEEALEIQEKNLTADHPDLIRTMHNLSVAYAGSGDMTKANEYFQRAEDIAQRTLLPKHPLIQLLKTTKYKVIEWVDQPHETASDQEPIDITEGKLSKSTGTGSCASQSTGATDVTTIQSASSQTHEEDWIGTDDIIELRF